MSKLFLTDEQKSNNMIIVLVKVLSFTLGLAVNEFFKHLISYSGDKYVVIKDIVYISCLSIALFLILDYNEIELSL